MTRKLITFFGIIGGLAIISALVFKVPSPINRYQYHAKTLPVPSTVTASSPVAANVCGGKTTPPAHYQHVIWILEENKSLHQVIGSSHAPFITNLSKRCAYTTNFTDNEPRTAHDKGYNSLSHYIADTSGSNCIIGNGPSGKSCITNAANKPAGHIFPGMSLFEQVATAGLTWKSYQESAPSNCSLVGKGLYVPRHDAAVYYSRIHHSCLSNDTPIPTLKTKPTGVLIDDIRNDTLPTFAYVTPNLRNDMHNNSVAAGDAWLRAYLEPLFQSKSYTSGQTAVFVIWDEANKAGQPLPNLFISASARPGAVNVPINGFGVLKTTEEMLGLPLLGCATGTPPGGAGQCYSGATTNVRQSLNL